MDFCKSKAGADVNYSSIQIKPENDTCNEENDNLINTVDSKRGLQPLTFLNCTKTLTPSEYCDLEVNSCVVKVEDETVQISTITPYTCDTCNATYDGLASYEVHLEDKHGLHIKHDMQHEIFMINGEKTTTRWFGNKSPSPIMVFENSENFKNTVEFGADFEISNQRSENECSPSTENSIYNICEDSPTLSQLDLISYDEDNFTTNSQSLLFQGKIPNDMKSAKETIGKIKPNGDYRKGRKGRDFCFFCKSRVLNFARHIERNHKTESEVINIFSLPAGSRKRKDLLTILRKKGNYLNGNEACKPVRIITSGGKALPCSNCLGFYSAKLLWLHRKRCVGTTEKLHQANSQNFLLKNIRVDKTLWEEVFPRMRPDDISLAAKKDPLICEFGARYIKIHSEKHRVNVASRKMRELSKLLIEFKKIQPSVRNLIEALAPKYYDSLVSAVKTIAKYDSERDFYKSPTYAITIGTSLKQCCDIALMFPVKREEVCATIPAAEAESDLRSLNQLMETQWSLEISSKAANDLKSKAKFLYDVDTDLEEDPLMNTEELNDDKNYTTDPLAEVYLNTPNIDQLIEKHKKHRTKRKRILIRWTEQQKKIVKTYFAEHIKNKKPPRKEECSKLKNQFGSVLENKDWLKIKVYIQNEYKKNI